MKKMILVFNLMVSIAANSQWSELGGMNGLSSLTSIQSICRDFSGNIYAVGDFINSNNKRYVAKWNGISWGELGGTNSSALNHGIYCIAIDNAGYIYVAGEFTNLNGKRYIAKWDGISWSELGGINSSTFNNSIQDIKIDAAGNIYVVGWFTNANGKVYVAKWDGTNWNELGGTNNSVFKGALISRLAIDAAGNIYACGGITNANNRLYVAKWDGTSWSELGGANSSTFNAGGINSIVIDALGNIYVGGSFTNGNSRPYVAKWNGNNWSELGGTNSNTFSNHMTIYVIKLDAAGNVYAGGTFYNANGKQYVAKWNGTSWSELGGNNSSPFNNSIFNFIFDTVENMYVVGGFKNTSGYNYVAKYTQPLPLKLLSFNAKLQTPNSVALNWQTANEVNVSHINIQRSNNGKDFTSIGKVNASCCSYEFTDDIRNLEFGIRNLFYRLEMVDKDGSKTYSTIQQITIKPQTPNIVLFPNPAKDLVTIECAGAKELLIIDYLGRTIKQFNNPTEHQTINTKQLTKGIYIVKAMMNNGDIKTEKLVIE